MPLAGLVVNRATPAPEGALSADEAMSAAARLQKTDRGSLTAGLLRLHADQARMRERETVLRERFAAAHPQVPTAVVPALAGDVHDLDGTAPGRRPARRVAHDVRNGERGSTPAREVDSGSPLPGDTGTRAGGRLKVTFR